MRRVPVILRRRLVAAVALAALLAGGCDRGAEQTVPTIGIVSIIEHPLLDRARQGFIDTLAADGYRDGETVRLDYRNALGKLENVSTIASSFAGNRVSLIYSLTTPATQVVKERVADIPIVFAAVTNPVEAGIVASEQAPGGHITGVSDRVPIERLFEALTKLLPNAKRLGLPYNAGEANSVAQIEEMRAVAPRFGLVLVEATAANTSEVSQAVSSLVGKVDVIYMLADNTMAAAVNVIADIAARNGLPFVSCEDDTVKHDMALASLVVDHYELGVIAARMAVRILRGDAKPGDIPVQRLENFALIANLRVAKTLGIDLPPDAIATATVIR